MKTFLLYLLLLNCVSMVVEAASRPNIIFILSDDQRADAIAAYGHPDVMTPTLDQLVKEGTSFREAYCMGSNSGAVCAPSRAMIMTGRSLYNIRGSYLVPWTAPEGEKGVCDHITMPEYFRSKGYTTFMSGKWHQDAPTFITGFDGGKHIFMGGMGSHTEVKIWDFDPSGKHYGKDDFHIVKGFSSTLFADAAVEFIENYEVTDKPFFMYVAFTAPHDPRTPPNHYKQQYVADEIQVPENYLPYHPFNQGELTIRDEKTEAFPRTKAVVQGALRDYYSMISQMDAQIGRIIEALKASGEYDNTYIVFASDHGLAIGSHGLMGKQNLYTHSMRAPLVISGPGIRKQAENQDFVYLYDIFPTVADLVGLEIPASIQGKSLKRILQVGKDESREYVFNAYTDKMRAISTADWKLIRYPKLAKSQLFNRKKDPHETQDLAGDPKYAKVLKKMEIKLRSAQQAFNDDLPYTAQKVVNGEYDPTTFFKEQQ